MQVVEIFTFDNARTEVSEMRIFSRPWPVTAYYRKCVFELLKGFPRARVLAGP